MRTRKYLPSAISLIIAAASFLISFAQILSNVPTPILIRTMILGEVIALLVLLLVVSKLDSFDSPRR